MFSVPPMQYQYEARAEPSEGGSQQSLASCGVLQLHTHPRSFGVGCRASPRLLSHDGTVIGVH